MKFEKIVQKMKRKGQNIWSIKDLEKFVVTASDDSQNTLYKLIHLLVSSGVLISIRKGLYLSGEIDGGKNLDPQDFYWNIVRKTIAELYGSQGVIVGQKALALLLKDYSLPETLSVIVPKQPKKITLLAGYTVVTICPQSEKKAGMYAQVKKYATKILVDDVPLWITCPEHAILEALTMRTVNEEGDSLMILRWLKKNSHTLRSEVFGEFVSKKYISAINRLKYLAYDHKYNHLYGLCITVIDIHGGGCHLSREFLKKKIK